MIEPIGLGHARADAGIDEVEEEQCGCSFRRASRHRLHRRAADVVTDNAGPCEAKRIHQRQHAAPLAWTVRCSMTGPSCCFFSLVCLCGNSSGLRLVWPSILA